MAVRTGVIRVGDGTESRFFAGATKVKVALTVEPLEEPALAEAQVGERSRFVERARL